jgi:tetratricopeptide (TPR) repeat protein
MEHGEPDAAARLLRSALAAHSGYPDLHLLLGSAEFRAGHLDDALVSFARALELHPDLHAARVEFARVLEALGQASQAAEQLRLVLEREPTHSQAGELAARWSRHGSPATRGITARNPS